MSQPTHTKVMALPAHQASTKAFLQLLATTARGEGMTERECLTRWLDAAATALQQPGLQLQAGLPFASSAAAQAKWDANEAQYMDLVRRCRQPAQTMAAFSHLLAITTMALENEASDFLGPIFSELSADSHGGQFFTPYELSRTIAYMVLHDARALLEQCRADGGNCITIQEPACGAGSMVLAANQVLREAGLDPGRHVHWQCVDTDRRVANCCFIQLQLTGCSAVVVHGNTLSLEQWATMPTLMAVMWPKRRGTVQAAATPAPVLVLPPAVADSTPAKAAQLAFDF